MEKNINEKIYTLKDLQKKLSVLKINLTSFFILQEDLTVSILIGTAYLGAFRKMIKTRNNLTKILKNYDMSNLHETLDFLNKNVVLTKEKKNVREKEAGDVIHLHLELIFLDIEIFYYEYLISIFLEKSNIESDFEFSLDYIEIFLEKIYEPKSENSVYFFSNILEEFKENIKQLEKNVKMLTIREKVNFFHFQSKLWNNIADLRKISHEHNKKYAQEFLKLLKKEMNLREFNELDSLFFKLQKNYYENICKCLEEKKIVSDLEFNEFPEYFMQYIIDLKTINNFDLIMEILDEQFCDLFDFKHNLFAFNELINFIFLKDAQESLYILKDASFYDKLMSDLNKNNEDLLTIFETMENESLKNVILFLTEEKQEKEWEFENKKEKYKDIAKKIEINQYENILIVLRKKEMEEEDYVVVFDNNENLAMLFEKLKIMRNVEKFKKNINQFNRILILLMKPSLSFDDFSILKLKLEKNIEELNIIKKTKEIEDFLSYIIAKDKKDLNLASKIGVPSLNILVLDFIQEHYDFIAKNLKEEKDEEFLCIKLDHLNFFFIKYHVIKNIM